MAVAYLPRAACQWSGQRLRFSLGILQNFPAKVTCMYSFLFFNSERIIFPWETTRKGIWFSISRVTCSVYDVIATDPTWPIYLLSENLKNNRAGCFVLIWCRHQRNLQGKVVFIMNQNKTYSNNMLGIFAKSRAQKVLVNWIPLL